MTDRHFAFRKLEPTDVLESFKCNNDDLNDFLINEAIDYQEQLLASTYLVIDTDNRDIVAYYSLLCDQIKFSADSKKARNSINRQIPHAKQRTHYPAMKIGRLAVDERYARQGIGQLILDNIKFALTSKPRFGCRILTVDAYANAVSFYERCGFRYFTETDADDDTRLMYYDLRNFR